MRSLKYTRGEVFRFAGVGASGFVVNTASLILLHQVLGLNLIPAQIISAEIAIAASFTLHHNWTYSKYTAEKLIRRFVKFNLSAATGSIITLAVLSAGVYLLHLHYLVALVCGGATAMLWNLMMNRLVIWRLHESDKTATKTTRPA